MDNGSSNPIWIAIVVLTAILMIAFLLFFGSHGQKNEEVPSTPQEKINVPKAPVTEQPGPAAGATETAPKS